VRKSLALSCAACIKENTCQQVQTLSDQNQAGPQGWFRDW
jgi:hypothetical protein